MYANGCKIKVTGTPKDDGRIPTKPELINKIGIIQSHAASNTPTLYTVKIGDKEYALYEDEITDECGKREGDIYLCTKRCPIINKMWCCCECEDRSCPRRCTTHTQTRERTEK